MSEQNIQKAPIFQGIQFDSTALNQLPIPALPGTTMSVNPLPLAAPDSVTPLGSADSAIAGLNEGAPRFGFVTRLTGPLGTVNDAVAVGQHLFTGRFENAIIEAGGVAGQGLGAATGYAAGSTLVTTAGAVFASTPPGAAVASGGVLVGGLLAWGGSTAGKEITTQALNEIQRTAELAPGQTVQPVATVDGVQYGLGLTVNGNLDWYRIDAASSDAGAGFGSGAVSSLNLADRNGLTDQLARASMTPLDYSSYTRTVDLMRTQGTGLQEWNVFQGRTPSGYEIGQLVYEVSGNTTSVGAGSSAQTVVPTTMVNSYVDPQTNAIVEVRVYGEMVNGQFQATGGSYAQGLTPGGKVVIPGLVDQMTQLLRRMRRSLSNNKTSLSEAKRPTPTALVPTASLGAQPP